MSSLEGLNVFEQNVISNLKLSPHEPINHWASTYAGGLPAPSAFCPELHASRPGEL